MFWLIPVLLLGGAAVAVVVIELLRMNRRNIAQEVLNRNQMRFYIQEKLRDGRYHVANVGLLDSNDNVIETIQVKSESLEDDFKVNTVYQMRH